MLENVPALEIWALVAPLLSDPIRGVRIRAAALIAAVPTADQPPADRDCRGAFGRQSFYCASPRRLRPSPASLGWH
jgi:hypothetical protein